jgi:hypothetical protein
MSTPETEATNTTEKTADTKNPEETKKVSFARPPGPVVLCEAIDHLIVKGGMQLAYERESGREGRELTIQVFEWFDSDEQLFELTIPEGTKFEKLEGKEGVYHHTCVDDPNLPYAKTNVHLYCGNEAPPLGVALKVRVQVHVWRIMPMFEARPGQKLYCNHSFSINAFVKDSEAEPVGRLVIETSESGSLNLQNPVLQQGACIRHRGQVIKLLMRQEAARLDERKRVEAERAAQKAAHKARKATPRRHTEQASTEQMSLADQLKAAVA